MMRKNPSVGQIRPARNIFFFDPRELGLLWPRIFPRSSIDQLSFLDTARSFSCQILVRRKTAAYPFNPYFSLRFSLGLYWNGNHGNAYLPAGYLLLALVALNKPLDRCR